MKIYFLLIEVRSEMWEVRFRVLIINITPHTSHFTPLTSIY